MNINIHILVILDMDSKKFIQVIYKVDKINTIPLSV